MTTTASRNGRAEANGRVPPGLADDGIELPEPDVGFMEAQLPFWKLVLDHYFRMEVRGWDRVPDPPVLVVGIHAGGILPIDAYAFGFSWYREFGFERPLRGTAHDFLTSSPIIGDYLKKIGVIPASPKGISAAFKA